MKKLSLITSLCFFCILGMNAKDVFDNPDNKPYWGVRASFDLSLPSKVMNEWNGEKHYYDLIGSGPGLSIGAIYNMPIVKNLYFEPGLSLYYNTYKGDLGVYDGASIGKFFNEYDFDVHNSYRTFGMRIPLNIGYHFDFTDNLNLSVFTGPVLEVGFSCDHYMKWKKQYDEPWGVIEYNWTGSAYSRKYLNRVNAYWNAGVGLTMKKYYVGVNGLFGITNIIHKKSDWDSAKMNLFQVSLGYNF